MWPARARGNKPRKRAANQGIVSLSCVTDRHRGMSSWLPDDWTNAPLSNRVGDFTKFYAYLQHEAFHKSIDGKECRVQKMRGRQSHATVSHRQMRRWKSWLNEALKFLLPYLQGRTTNSIFDSMFWSKSVRYIPTHHMTVQEGKSTYTFFPVGMEPTRTFHNNFL